MNLATKHLEDNYEEVSAHDFYRELFPQGSLTDGINAVALCVRDGKAELKTIEDDLRTIEEAISTDDFIVISPIAYAGKSQKQSRAKELFAIVFDVDGLKIKDDECIGLKDLLHQMKVERKETPTFLPQASYIASSGNGVHVYYLLDKPIKIHNPATIESIRRFRHSIVKRMWNDYVTRLFATPQFESATQGFRAVGSIAKDGKQRVRVFRTGDRVSIDYLNKFVDDKHRIEEVNNTSQLTLDEAKEKYPDWYEKRIVKGQPKGTWLVKEDLYNWWLSRISVEAKEGHRYFCIMALAIYARKCGIPMNRLRKDAYSLLKSFDALTTAEDNHFTEDEIEKALQAYRTPYITFPRKNIEELTDISMPANKRNGRKQAQHMVYMNGINALRRTMGENIECGRKPKRKEIVSYIAEHPHLSNRKIAEALNVSRNTVNKYAQEIKQSGMTATDYLKTLD